MLRECESHYVPVSRESLAAFTREALRDYAKHLGVERGQNKRDTIENLLQSGKARIYGCLADPT